MSTKSHGIVLRTYRLFSNIFLLYNLLCLTWNSAPSISRMNQFTVGWPIAASNVYRGTHCIGWRMSCTVFRIKDSVTMFPFLMRSWGHTGLRHYPRHAPLVGLLVYHHGGGVFPVNKLWTCISGLINKESLLDIRLLSKVRFCYTRG